MRLHRDGASVPALLKAGGILPLAAEHETDATRNPQHLEVLVAPGADGAFVLVEDDDTGTTPETIPTVRTPLAWDQASGIAHHRTGGRPGRHRAGDAAPGR